MDSVLLGIVQGWALALLAIFGALGLWALWEAFRGR